MPQNYLTLQSKQYNIIIKEINFFYSSLWWSCFTFFGSKHGYKLKGRELWKANLAVAPDDNKGKHLNFSSQYGVTWRQAKLIRSCTTGENTLQCKGAIIVTKLYNSVFIKFLVQKIVYFYKCVWQIIVIFL